MFKNAVECCMNNGYSKPCNKYYFKKLFFPGDSAFMDFL
jgi:hypothetical protein